MSNRPNTQEVESLRGNGTQAPQHTVEPSWNSRISREAGYNVYRSTRSGGPYTKMTSTLDVSTAQAELTYYYVVTEVDTIDHSESKYSNQAQAVIP